MAMKWSEFRGPEIFIEFGQVVLAANYANYANGRIESLLLLCVWPDA
jgi:hypothetical protein